MNKRGFFRLGLMIFLVLVLAGVVLSFRQPPNPPVQARLEGAAPALGVFKRAEGPPELVFPRDHGPHEDFQTEWWYYTGNLEGDQGERFGFQLTFFRRALLGPDLRSQRDSDWAADQVYLAHFAVTDGDGRTFRAFERFERGAAGLAGAQGDPEFKVWLQDWRVTQIGPDTYALQAADKDTELRLTLFDSKGPILQGDRGYSQKGPDEGNASIYISQTRLEAEGSLTLDGVRYAVKGLSWMDHEYSTSALSEGQVGWDWFSIQLDDQSELMFYTIRQEDGSVDPFSKGTLIGPDGSTRSLSAQDFRIEVGAEWTSPRSGGVYPAQWTVTIPSEQLTLRIRPLIPDQELNVSFVYWEGAVVVEGERTDQVVSGRGYVELTGYAQSLENQF